jgi:hypothetical protein
MRDCTTWAHPHQNPDTVRVHANAHEICVKVERISLGTPLDPWEVGVATDTGESAPFQIAITEDPVLLGYCQVHGKLRSTWANTAAGCTANDGLLTAASVYLVVRRTGAPEHELAAFLFDTATHPLAQRHAPRHAP